MPLPLGRRLRCGVRGMATVGGDGEAVLGGIATARLASYVWCDTDGALSFVIARLGSFNGYDDSSGAIRHRRNTTTSYTIPVYTNVWGSSAALSLSNGSASVSTACTACGVSGFCGDTERGDTSPLLLPSPPPSSLSFPSPPLRIGLRRCAGSPLIGFSRSRWSTLAGGGGASGDVDVGAGSEAAGAAATDGSGVVVGSASGGGEGGGVCFCFGDMALRSNPLENSSNASSSSSSNESESEP